MKKYLFIAGCARSGTSALAQLIGSHKEIVMGMERFGHLSLKNNFKLTKELFEAERFLNIHDDDTFYTDFKKFHAWDKDINIKVKNYDLKYIGDKRPELYTVYDELFQNFPEAKIIFIYRNVYEVAASWNKRAESKENWPASKDFKQAVYNWNNSLNLTIEALDKYQNNIVCLRYEDIFLNEMDLKPLYKWLDLEMDNATLEKYKNILFNSKRLQKERENFQLSEEQVNFCKNAASFRFEKQLDEIKIIREN